MNKIKHLFQYSSWGQEMFNKGIEFGKKQAMQDAIKEVEKTLPDIDALVTERISTLLGTVDERKVVKIDVVKNIVFLGDQMVDSATRHNLQQEAELLSKLDLWHLMTNTIEATAQKRIFVDSKTAEDILAGKMALYNLSLMKKILTVFLGK